jgi:molybdate transport repressor ModE-like protein
VIDVERLLILREVARHGSKAAAARATGLSEPTVAHHLKALERHAGVPLTRRVGRVTKVTPAGEALLEHANVIAASLEGAKRTLHRHADLNVGRLRIAAFQSYCASALPGPLAQFARTYPGIEVGLVETETDDALALMRAGEADLVIGFADNATPAPTDVPVRPLDRDEYLVILPDSHVQAKRKRVDIATLAGERWISGCARCRAHLAAHAAHAGFSPDVAFITEDYVTAQKLVAERLGVALLPRMAVEASPAVPGIVTARTKPANYREVFVSIPRDAAPAAQAFANLLVSVQPQ